jgi:hypothetical protein
MSAIHISSRDRGEIQRIINSARERQSLILYYDALRILKLAGASVVNSFLALNAQEVMVFSSQVEPPIVLKRIEYDKLPYGGIETYKGISRPLDVLDVALKDREYLEGTSFVIQETAPSDLKLRIICDEKEIRIEDVKNGVQIILPAVLDLSGLISQKDTLKTFLFNATESEEYDIKALGMLLLILSSIKTTFSDIDSIDIRSLFLYREGLGYIITDALIFLR